MARVIKAGQDKAKAPRRPLPPRIGQPGRPVIEKEVYWAQQEAARIQEEAEEERERILAEGKRQAAQAREEAQAQGAQEAFAQAAQEALAAFRHRAERYAEAADDIRLLALEVVKKILGAEPQLGPRAVEAILERGLSRLRARRRLRVQVPDARLSALSRERPALLAALKREPDLVLEAAFDVSPGFARVVTEVGGALCSEQTALDALAEAVNVDEQAIAPPPRSAIYPIGKEEGEKDEATLALSRPQRERPKADARAKKPVPRRGGIGLAVTTPEVHVPDIQAGESARVRPLDEADPDATMALDVSDLQEELSQVESAGDDLDLYADDSVPEP